MLKVRYIQETLGANDDVSSPNEQTKHPSQAIFLQPKCSIKAVDRGPLRKIRPYASDPTHAKKKQKNYFKISILTFYYRRNYKSPETKLINMKLQKLDKVVPLSFESAAYNI